MKIILSDGRVIDNLTKNLDVYVSKKILDKSMFEGNLRTIKEVLDDGTEVLLKNQKLGSLVYNVENDSWDFVLIEIPLEDLRYAQTRSDIMYIAMMADVELGEEPEGLSIY